MTILPNGIEVEGLAREVKGGVRAVDGIDLTVEPGESYGVLRPNRTRKRHTLATPHRPLWLPRADRRRQVDHGAHAHHAAAAQLGHRAGGRLRHRARRPGGPPGHR